MKISGVFICIVGVFMVVFSDVHAGDRAGNGFWKLLLIHDYVFNHGFIEFWWFFSGGSNPVKRDFLVLGGATLYAVSNTSEVSKCHNKNMLLYRAKM